MSLIPVLHRLLHGLYVFGCTDLCLWPSTLCLPSLLVCGTLVQEGTEIVDLTGVPDSDVDCVDEPAAINHSQSGSATTSGDVGSTSCSYGSIAAVDGDGSHIGADASTSTSSVGLVHPAITSVPSSSTISYYPDHLNNCVDFTSSTSELDSNVPGALDVALCDGYYVGGTPHVPPVGLVPTPLPSSAYSPVSSVDYDAIFNYLISSPSRDPPVSSIGRANLPGPLPTYNSSLSSASTSPYDEMLPPVLGWNSPPINNFFNPDEPWV